jgi:hypothetical protein
MINPNDYVIVMKDDKPFYCGQAGTIVGFKGDEIRIGGIDIFDRKSHMGPNGTYAILSFKEESERISKFIEEERKKGEDAPLIAAEAWFDTLKSEEKAFVNTLVDNWGN